MMGQESQLPLFERAVVGPGAQGQGLWLGLVLPHRQLFEGLQEDILLPTFDAHGHVLGVACFHEARETVPRENSIPVFIRFPVSGFPNVVVHIRRHGRWRKSAVNEVTDEDEAVYWHGALPAFSGHELAVLSSENRARLLGIARQVSNVTFVEPSVESNLASSIPPSPPNESFEPKSERPSIVDAIRGATAMASWAVPRVDPWLDLFVASLGADRELLLQRANEVGAPWWRVPPWQHTLLDEDPRSRDEAFWLAANSVFAERVHSRPDVVEIAAEFCRRVVRRYGVAAELVDPWYRETVAILRSDQQFRRNWRQDPVGRAIQLVLTRPEPAVFKKWLDDLADVPPAVWWSAATLCGLFHGYRRLDTQFRGEAEQKKLFFAYCMQSAGVGAAVAPWSPAVGVPAWHREGRQVVLSWGERDFATWPEHARGKWLHADLERDETRRAAEDLAQRFRWPCFGQTLSLTNEELTLSGSGSLLLTENRLTASGEVKVHLPPTMRVERSFDQRAFRRCLVVEGGAPLPAPPSSVPNPLQTPLSGMFYWPDFVAEAEARELVEVIDSEPWRADMKRRVQHYGWRYDYKARRVDASMRIGPLPTWAAHLADRLNTERALPHVPDQVIVNEYVGSQGISKHVDCPTCFADGIGMISLLEPWEMLFRQGNNTFAIVLQPRSLLVLTDEARFNWTHEIPQRKTEPSGLERKRRISITFRKVLLADSEPPAPRRKSSPTKPRVTRHS